VSAPPESSRFVAIAGRTSEQALIGVREVLDRVVGLEAAGEE
jgi:hypothetical protein